MNLFNFIFNLWECGRSNWACARVRPLKRGKKCFLTRNFSLVLSIDRVGRRKIARVSDSVARSRNYKIQWRIFATLNNRQKIKIEFSCAKMFKVEWRNFEKKSCVNWNLRYNFSTQIASFCDANESEYSWVNSVGAINFSHAKMIVLPAASRQMTQLIYKDCEAVAFCIS